MATIIALGPLASCAAAFMCSAVQQRSMKSFLNRSIPPTARHALYFQWFSEFKKAMYLSAPSHLLTLVLCFINLASSTSRATSTLWTGGIFFTIAHVYPIRLGVRHLTLSQDGWNEKSTGEAFAWVKSFVDVNGQRLLIVDLPGFLCIAGAVVLENLR
ncbi:predicted protein [Uncinocarpus reesii 1704]|uniref:Uncharacterized protein n=1 Tax=Uncinocarpus reesii (strain UAMH 1704) TaxID=336963 RepID=C4JLV9_UNCRE|nr:uncharacterized protein UREG_03817 [Uncinocarpus reesii 1704]EEP78971.1 predicted protein [Uncinocarpus reesii 1704]